MIDIFDPDRANALVSHFDEHDVSRGKHPRSDEIVGVRIMKIAEELGETVEAWIGVIGQNPRKGNYASHEDVMVELADVIVTAWVALCSMSTTRTARAVMMARHRELFERVGIPT